MYKCERVTKDKQRLRDLSSSVMPTGATTCLLLCSRCCSHCKWKMKPILRSYEWYLYLLFVYIWTSGDKIYIQNHLLIHLNSKFGQKDAIQLAKVKTLKAKRNLLSSFHVTDNLIVLVSRLLSFAFAFAFHSIFKVFVGYFWLNSRFECLKKKSTEKYIMRMWADVGRKIHLNCTNICRKFSKLFIFGSQTFGCSLVPAIQTNSVNWTTNRSSK